MNTDVSPATRPNPWLIVGLFALPMLMYGSQIARWGIDRDEVYTFIDSSLPISELLEWETKPLYYLLCHGLLSLNLDWPTEVLLRLPSAVASALIPVAAYLGLRLGGKAENAAILSAVLLWINPWIFGFAVTARFYGLVTLLVVIATAQLMHWHECRKLRWLVFFAITTVTAIATHTTVITLLPAACLAVFVTYYCEDRASVSRWLMRWAPIGLLAILSCLIVGWWILADQFAFWLHSKPDQFGNYTAQQLALSLLANVGIPVWALAIIPLCTAIRDWDGINRLLVVLIVAGMGPLLLLVPYGGGVAPHYLLAGVIPAFVLAGRHWSELNTHIESNSFRLAVSCAVLSFFLPSLASTFLNGGHFDYKNAAFYVDQVTPEDAILASSGHLNLAFYLPGRDDIRELGTFEGGIPRERLQALATDADQQARPLILVSRETRFRLSESDQDWFYRRFALIRDFESLRYDHRRHRVAIYEYRPARQPLEPSPEFTMISIEAKTEPPQVGAP